MRGYKKFADGYEYHWEFFEKRCWQYNFKVIWYKTSQGVVQTTTDLGTKKKQKSLEKVLDSLKIKW